MLQRESVFIDMYSFVQLCRWKEERQRDVDLLKKEREALSAAIQAEIARLRAENDQLRRNFYIYDSLLLC